MKIDINFFKHWFNSRIKINNIVNDLTSLGFESFIEKNIITISIPNNRPDCSNLLSILDEISKIYKITNLSKYKFKNQVKKKYDIQINIQDKNFCPIYNYIIIKNINNKLASPSYITKFLTLNNFNTHNFIIDNLNFTTLITGQPLHAYDLDKFEKKIYIEKSNNNSTITSVNDTEIKIKKNIFIINDKNNIMAVPGIIGTKYAKIDKNTKNILIESAYFNNITIEALEKEIDIITYSSTLFRNGINPNLSKTSLYYITHLLHKSNKINYYNINQTKTKEYLPQKKYISIKKKLLDKIIGNKIEEKNLNLILNKINLQSKIFKNHIKFTISINRNDLQIKENIISEIIKFYGYKKIKLQPILFKIPFDSTNTYIKKYYKNKIINFFLTHGFYEVITYSFVEKNIEKFINNEKNLILLKNPMSNKMDTMRSSLLQGLLKTLQLNYNKNNENINLFEIGNIYVKDINNDFKTKKKIACVFSENENIKDNENYDSNKNFFFIKKLIEIIYINIYQYKEHDILFKKIKQNYFDPILSSQILLKNNIIGEYGLLNRKLSIKMPKKKNIFFCQIDLLDDITLPIVKMNHISKFPKIVRDLSIIINKTIPYENLKTYLKSLNIIHLVKIDFINTFILDDKNKSISLRFIFQSKSATLTDNEINEKIRDLMQALEKNFNASFKI